MLHKYSIVTQIKARMFSTIKVQHNYKNLHSIIIAVPKRHLLSQHFIFFITYD